MSDLAGMAARALRDVDPEIPEDAHLRHEARIELATHRIADQRPGVYFNEIEDAVRAATGSCPCSRCGGEGSAGETRRGQIPASWWVTWEQVDARSDTWVDDRPMTPTSDAIAFWQARAVPGRCVIVALILAETQEDAARIARDAWSPGVGRMSARRNDAGSPPPLWGK